jgi:TolB-like protein
MEEVRMYPLREDDGRLFAALRGVMLRVGVSVGGARGGMAAAWAAAAAPLLCGCIGIGPTYEEAANSSLIAANYQAADSLMSRTTLDPAKAILIANLVDIDDPNRSSKLGRLVAEHVSSRLAQRGLPVLAIEVPSRPALQQTSQADRLLSHEARELAAARGVQAVVVGTYAQADYYVYVTLKLIRTVDSVVLAAHNYALPVDDNVASLLPRIPFQ